MVKIGILSVAHMHSHSYARWIKVNPDCELVGVYDDDAERGKRAADEFHVPFFEDPAQLFAQALNGVVICSENSKHLFYTTMAAENGVHILCEKPIATSVEDGQKMIDICKANDVQLQMAFPCRFHPTASRVKGILEGGRIGKLLAIKGTNHGRMPGGWFVKKELSGGGAVIDHTVHVVDLIRWMTGLEVASVYAEIDTLMNEGLGVDDVGLLTMALSSGAFATLDTSWSRPKSFHAWGDVTIEFTGTDGVLSLDMFAQNLTLYDDRTNGVRTENWGDDMDKGLVNDFINMLKSGAKASVTGFDGLQATKVALAAYDSATIGSPKTIKD